MWLERRISHWQVDGMTSLSVRQYILGVLKAHGLNEKDVTKVGPPHIARKQTEGSNQFQTGGPDGDLGSSTHFLHRDVLSLISFRRDLIEQRQDHCHYRRIRCTV